MHEDVIARGTSSSGRARPAQRLCLSPLEPCSAESSSESEGRRYLDQHEFLHGSVPLQQHHARFQRSTEVVPAAWHIPGCKEREKAGLPKGAPENPPPPISSPRGFVWRPSAFLYLWFVASQRGLLWTTEDEREGGGPRLHLQAWLDLHSPVQHRWHPFVSGILVVTTFFLEERKDG